MAITGTASGSKTGGGGINWGSILTTYGPAALEAFQAFSANRASNRATDEQVDAIGDAGQLQYQTALQAMELARQRDMQTRLDTEQSRFGGYNAMRTIARQLGLPVYDQPFNRTLDTFRPGAGGGVGVGGGTGQVAAGGIPGGGGIPFGVGDNEFRPRNPSAGQSAASGAATGASIGSAFGPVGTVVGGVLGGAAGYFGATEGGDLKDGSRVYATKNGTFFDARGNVIARVPPPAAGEGLKQIPGLQRNGAALYIDERGNIVRPNKAGGGYGTLTNLSSLADRPIEINGVIAREYQPLPATDDELRVLGVNPDRFSTDPARQAAAFNPQQGTIGILPGEAQGTGLIQDAAGTGMSPGTAPPPLAEGRYAGFEATPGYQFVLDEGLRARDKMASSRGRYFSGGTGRELERYAQGVASQEYDNYFRRLMDQVTGGNSATQFTSSAGAGQTGSAINSLTGGADSLGSALVAAGNARGSGILAGQQIANSGIAGIAGSGIFDRLGSIFGGRTSGGLTKSTTGGSSGAKSPLSSYNANGYNLDSIRAYGG